MLRIIRCVIAVQQIQFHAADLHLPGTQPERVPGQRDLQTHPLAIGFAQWRDRELAGIIVRKQRLLRAVLVDHLTEIALLIEQSDADNRHAQIARGLELVTGDVAKSARVSANASLSMNSMLK